MNAKTALESEIEYRTEDEGPQSFSAGLLDEKGITFFLESVEAHEGAYKDPQTGEPRPFYTASGVDANGNPVSLAFGSKRLKKVLDKVLTTRGEELVNYMVNISGRGQGFDRNYTIKLVPKPQ
jgi:hypothetical protein